MAKILSFYFYKMERKPIYIFAGFNGEYKIDNAYYLFKNARKHEEYKSYYICRVKFNEDVLIKNTVKSIIYIILAKKIYVSHSESDLLDYVWRFLHVDVIFVQHGVISLKKLPEYESKKYHGFVCSNYLEERILKQFYCVNDKNIIKSGLPRFDLLTRENINKSISQSSNLNSILVMYTWRNFNDFSIDKYINHIENRLSSLSKTKYKIYVSLHPMLSKVKVGRNFEPYALERIEFIEQSRLSEMIMNTDILITDYSSVSWDYIYQGKVIIFDQFDLAEYNEKIGMYFNVANYYGLTYDDAIVLDLLSKPDCLEVIKKKNFDFIEKNPFYGQELNRAETILNWCR